jgi:hypothetical protein
MSGEDQCAGLQSNLEHVEHWTLSTKEEAVSVFQQKSALEDGDAVAGEEPSSSHSLQNGRDAATAQALQAVYLSNVLVYPNNTSTILLQLVLLQRMASTVRTSKPPMHQHRRQRRRMNIGVVLAVRKWMCWYSDPNIPKRNTLRR